MASLPASMANGTVLYIPSNGANVIQTAPGLPSIALQVPGATPYPQCGAQQLGISTSAPQQVPQKSLMETFLSAEAKVLGAIQIIIGLIHIGFGAVSLCLIRSDYLNLSGLGGYPIWGGIFFIISGSLCVTAAKHPNRGLVQSSVGMNITSAIMALIGIILYLCEMIMNNRYSRYDHIYNTGDFTIRIIFPHVYSLLHIISVMVSPVCCSCSASWNFASLFHLHTLGARQLAVVMTSQSCIFCLTNSSDVELSQMNQILLQHHRLTIAWIPNQNKTRTPGRK